MQKIDTNADLLSVLRRLADRTHAGEADMEQRRTRNAETAGSTPVTSTMQGGYLTF
jgi:hypothetical protein